MKKILLVIPLIILLWSCQKPKLAIKEIPVSISEKFEKASKRDRMDLAWQQEFEKTKDPATNTVPRDRLIQAKAYKDRITQLNSRAGITGIGWTERGPNNVAGRTRAFMFDANDNTNNTVFAGSVAGGLYRGTDFQSGTPIWTHVDEFWDNLAVSAIKQDPSTPNTIYVGTGEGWGNLDAVQGLGIWKSINGGTSFSQLAASSGIGFVNDLEVASNGDIYVATRFFGLVKSSDGGVSFSTVLSTSVNGLDLSGTSTPTGSARFGDIEIGADGDIYASSYGEVWKSDAGTYGATTGNTGNWVRVFPPASGTGSASTIDRLEMAVAPSDADRLYILGEGVGSDDVTEMYRCENMSGDPLSSAPTYTDLSSSIPTIYDQGSFPVFTRGQAWYNLIAVVDPNDADNLYIGGIDALRSYDKGVTWEQMSIWTLGGGAAGLGWTNANYIHADHHNIVFEPGSSSNMVIASDGGLFYSNNVNVSSPTRPTWTDVNGSTFRTVQYYACAMDPTANTDYYLAGAQDNGSHQFTNTGLGSVFEVTGGDGGFCHIDENEPNIQITSFIRNQYRISTNSFASFSFVNISSSIGNFINQTDYDSDNNILYGSYGNGNLLRLSGIGATLTSTTISIGGVVSSSEISSVTVSPNTSTTVYTGWENGYIIRVDNANTAPAGATIFDPSTYGVAGATTSCISIEEGDEDHILITFSNYGVTSVFETTDGGTSWTAVEGNLPDMPIRWIEFVPGQNDQALVATELGVWSTDNLDGGSTIWDASNSGLANVRVDMLQTRGTDNQVTAATHGRGLYTTDFFSTASINFSNTLTSAAEGSSGGNKAAPDDCLGYIDYVTEVAISQRPTTGDADVTVSVSGSSTATEGIDFDLITTGLTFTTAGVTVQEVTIRVYDDGAVEANESIVLELTLDNPGTTDAIIGASSETSIDITSEDSAPFIGTAEADYGDVSGTNSTISPFQGSKTDDKWQYLYLASDLIAAGLPAGASISALDFLVGTKASTQPFDNFSLKLKNTATTIPPGSFETGMTEVFTGSVTTASLSYNRINFTSNFEWDGTSNLLIETCWSNSSTSSDDPVFVEILGGNQAWVNLSPSTPGCNTVTTSNSYNGIPELRFVYDATTDIEETIVSTEEYLGPNETVYFYDATGEILARIDNGSHDFGCTTVEIDRAGTGATDFWYTGVTDYQMMDKTWNVTPTNSSSSASYDITFYLSNDELNGWTAATGNAIGDMVCYKGSGVSAASVTPSNNFVQSFDSSAIVDGTHGTKGFTITASFADGFSGFALGVAGPAPAPQPVEFLDISARFNEGQIDLIWATASEINNKGFYVQRSLDGQDFEEVGFVNGYGNSVVQRDYLFIDDEIPFGNQTYYYRLRQVDFDGTQDFSDQVEVFVPAVSIGMKVRQGNGVSKLTFNQILDEQGKIEIYNMNGALVYSLTEGELNSKSYVLPSEQLGSGMYLIRTSLQNGRMMTAKWINN